MIWLDWRRWRILIVISVLLVAALVFMMVHTGLDNESENTTFRNMHCIAVLTLYGQPARVLQAMGVHQPVTKTTHGECLRLSSQITWGPDSAAWFRFFVLAVPCVIGVLLAAPLVAEEYRRKTHRVLWTQSVSRTKWFVSSLALTTGICLILIVPLAAVVPWYTRLYPGTFVDKLSPLQFDISGITPFAYAIFATAMAALLGVLFRFSLPAIVGGVTFFSLARWGFQVLRFRIVRPTSLVIAKYSVNTGPFFTANYPPSGSGIPSDLKGALVQNAGYVPLGRMSPSPGHSWNSYFPPQSCLTGNPASPQILTPAQTVQCIASHGYHLVVQYQPVSHFWLLQGVEAASFTAVAALCFVTSIWLIWRLSR